MATIDEIRAAFDRICRSSESIGIDETIDEDAALVDRALDELAELRKKTGEGYAFRQRDDARDASSRVAG